METGRRENAGSFGDPRAIHGGRRRNYLLNWRGEISRKQVVVLPDEEPHPRYHNYSEMESVGAGFVAVRGGWPECARRVRIVRFPRRSWDSWASVGLRPPALLVWRCSLSRRYKYVELTVVGT